MSVTQITQTITPYTTNPTRATTPIELFESEADTRITEQSTNTTEFNILIPQINTIAGEINTIGENADTSATNAASSESNAAASASQAAAAANNNGAWSGLTGALDAGQAVNHNGGVWISNNSIADITLSEPSSNNSDWTLVTFSDSWEAAQSSNFTLESGKKYFIDGSSGTVDAALPGTIEQGDEFKVHNNANSTGTVRVTNASFTIRGANGTASAGDNITLSAGQTLTLAAVTTSILEIV